MAKFAPSIHYVNADRYAFGSQTRMTFLGWCSAVFWIVLLQSSAFALQDRLSSNEIKVIKARQECKAQPALTDFQATTVQGMHRSKNVGRPKTQLPRCSAHSTQLHVDVCGVAELPRFSGTKTTHVISIWNRSEETNIMVRHCVRRMFPNARISYAFFDDVLNENATSGPTLAEVRSILQKTAPLRSDDALLVHCTMGISRSTAIAFAALCQHAGRGREAACLTKLRELRPNAKPNSLIVRYADMILGRNGAMVSALATKTGASGSLTLAKRNAALAYPLSRQLGVGG